MSTGSVNLERIHRYDGGIGIGSHSVSDNGQLGYLGRDPLAARTYRLTSLIPTDPKESEQLIVRTGFSLESVQHAGCPPDATWTYLITDHDIYFILQNESVARRSSLQVRHGDTFLGLEVSGDDPRRTAVALTQDRGSTSFTITLLEAPDDSGALAVVWSKTWGEPVLAVAVSSDGTFVVASHQNGNITLLDRHRRTMWVYASAEESPVIAIAVDNSGSVTALDSGGAIKRHSAEDGSVLWRLRMPVNHPDVRGNLPGALLTVDSQTRTVLCAVNRSQHLDDVHGSYVYMNGRNGDVLWDDQIDSAITGIAMSPNGSCSAISNQAGEIMLMSISSRKQRLAGADVELANQLLDRAQRSFNNHNFAKAVRVLLEIFAIDPAMVGIGALYDEATWHLRESVMKRTTAISAESLAKVEEALFIMPFDERLTIRRNALARLLAENLGKEASECMQEGRLDDAIAKLREALTIDRSQTELRNSLRIASDQLALALIKDADAAFQDERFAEAIDMLEQVQELRPGETAVSGRLDHAKGLHAYATGMVHYIAKRYPEASFWFRKTLSLLPDHAEAARYLGFAEKFSREQILEATTKRPPEAAPVSDRFAAIAMENSADQSAGTTGPPMFEDEQTISFDSDAPTAQPAPDQPSAARQMPARIPPPPVPARTRPVLRTSTLPPIGGATRPTLPSAPTSAPGSGARPTAPPAGPSPTKPSSSDISNFWKR